LYFPHNPRLRMRLNTCIGTSRKMATRRGEDLSQMKLSSLHYRSASNPVTRRMYSYPVTRRISTFEVK